MSADRARVWVEFRGRETAAVSALRATARELGFRQFVGDPTLARAGERWATRDGLRLAVDGAAPLLERRVRTVSDLDDALERLARGERLLLRWTEDRVIPHERLVAEGTRRGTLWVVARSPDELPAALGALEHGADGVVAEARSSTDLARYDDLLEPELPRLSWTSARVETVAPGGVGDRVIVDTTSALRPTEGLLVGGQAAFLFHVASEAEGSAFSRPRSFRVNAGALHSYVLLASGETRYLSELDAGDRVLAVAPGAGPRVVRVGRVKIERRPLTLVRARSGTRRFTIFTQEAETVRLSSRNARTPVTALRPGMILVGVRLPPGRHLGKAVEETVEER